MNDLNGCFLITFTLVAYIAIACYCDICFKVIYNRLNIIFFLVALTAQYCSGGLPGVATAFAGVLAGFFILIIPYRKEWACGGDVKFLLTLGAFIGPSQVFFSTLYGFILMGIVSAIYLLICGKTGRKQEGKESGSAVERFPLSVFFGLGALFYWLYNLLVLSQG